MEDTEKMLIERECERLVTQYCHFVDHDEATRIADLFAEDGVCDLTQVSWTGRDRIRKGFQGRENNKKRMSRHVCNNLLIDVIRPTEAVGTVYITLFFHDGEPGRETSPTDCLQKLGEYKDRFVKTEEGWRFARREMTANFWRAQ